MANRLVRNTVILLKLEGTGSYGVDPTPVQAPDAMQVTNLSITPIVPNNVDRNLIRSYLGASEQLLGTKYIELGFDIELAGSGTVATAPAWAAPLIACGFAQPGFGCLQINLCLELAIAVHISLEQRINELEPRVQFFVAVVGVDAYQLKQRVEPLIHVVCVQRALKLNHFVLYYALQRSHLASQHAGRQGEAGGGVFF
jgi:hypothetical protein